MDHLMLEKFYDKEVVLVVQGHLMRGYLRRLTNHICNGYASLESITEADKALYESAIIKIDQVGAIRAVKESV